MADKRGHFLSAGGARGSPLPFPTLKRRMFPLFSVVLGEVARQHSPSGAPGGPWGYRVHPVLYICKGFAVSVKDGGAARGRGIVGSCP